MGFAEYEDYDGLGLADLVRTGQVGATDILEAAIEPIEERNPALNAVIWKAYDRARPRSSPDHRGGLLPGYLSFSKTWNLLIGVHRSPTARGP